MGWPPVVVVPSRPLLQRTILSRCRCGRDDPGTFTHHDLMTATTPNLIWMAKGPGASPTMSHYPHRKKLSSSAPTVPQVLYAVWSHHGTGAIFLLTGAVKQ